MVNTGAKNLDAELLMSEIVEESERPILLRYSRRSPLDDMHLSIEQPCLSYTCL